MADCKRPAEPFLLIIDDRHSHDAAVSTDRLVAIDIKSPADEEVLLSARIG